MVNVVTNEVNAKGKLLIQHQVDTQVLTLNYIQKNGYQFLDYAYLSQEYLAEGEELPSERRARLAREAEERDRRRQAGEFRTVALFNKKRKTTNNTNLFLSQVKRRG